MYFSANIWHSFFSLLIAIVHFDLISTPTNLKANIKLTQNLDRKEKRGEDYILPPTHHFLQINKKSYYYLCEAYAKLQGKTRPILALIDRN